MDIFWGGPIHNMTIFRVIILCILGSFLTVKVQNGGYFLGSLKFQFFLGVLEIPNIFGGRTVDAEPEPTYEEKNQSTPLGFWYRKLVCDYRIS